MDALLAAGRSSGRKRRPGGGGDTMRLALAKNSVVISDNVS